MRVLVTGGCGFIGSNFLHLVMGKYQDAEIVNLDKLTYCGNEENLKDIASDPRYTFVKGDICDKELVEKTMSGVDIVVNFAAETHVDRSIKYSDDFLRTNVFGVKVMLDAARKAEVKKFIQIGTDEVYGSVSDGLSVETDPLKPRSPYSSTKASGDLLALSYYSTYELPVTVVRSSNNFGPYQYPEKVIPLFITNLVDDKKVPLYGEGANVRDWLYVKDNCSAIDVVMNKGKAGEVYNIGGGNLLTNKEITFKLLAAMGKEEDSIELVADRPGHDRRYALNSEKVKALGWTPEKDFQTDLDSTVSWYKDNESWWRTLKDKAEIITW